MRGDAGTTRSWRANRLVTHAVEELHFRALRCVCGGQKQDAVSLLFLWTVEHNDMETLRAATMSSEVPNESRIGGGAESQRERGDDMLSQHP